MRANDSPPGPPAVSTRTELRQLIETLLPGDSELSSFILQQFPRIIESLRPGLSRLAKIELLLDQADHAQLLRYLRELGRQEQRTLAREIPDFSRERSQQVELLGRQAEMNQLMPALRRDGWVLIVGEAGFGKTALMTRVLQLCKESSGVLWPHHFLSRMEGETTRPQAVQRSLAAQLEALYPRFAEPGAAPEQRLHGLLQRVVEKGLRPGSRLLLFIDGLDEADFSEVGNPLPLLLPPRLPERVTVVCTMRPSFRYARWLWEHTESQLVTKLMLDSPEQRGSSGACAAYLLAHRTEMKLSDPELAQAVSACAGNLLAAVTLRQACRLEASSTKSALLAALAQGGLRGLVQVLWTQLPAASQTALGLCCAARTALPVSLLGELLGWRTARVEAFVQQAQPLLQLAPLARDVAVTEQGVRIAHSALREQLMVLVGQTTLYQSHRQLAGALCCWPPIEDALYGYRRYYALRNALAQHSATESVAQIEQLTSNQEYLSAACLELGSAALAEELEQAAASATEVEVARTLAGLARAVRLLLRWLTLDPGALPGLLYNLLRCLHFGGQSPGSPSIPIIERLLQSLPARLRHRLRHPLQHRDQSVLMLSGHLDAVVLCQVLAGGTQLLSLSLDQTLRVWDLGSGALRQQLPAQVVSAASLAVLPDGRRAVYASVTHVLRLVELDTGEEQRRFVGHTGKITAVCVAADGLRVASASSDGTTRLWNLHSGECLKTLTGHRIAPSQLLFFSEGRRLVSASADHTLRVWDLETGSCVHELLGHSGPVTAMCLVPGEKLLVSASQDGSLRVWELHSGALVQLLAGHSKAVHSCVCDVAGTIVASASEDQTVRLWDLARGQELRALGGHRQPVRGCLLLPDGRTLFALLDDGLLMQWDLKAGAVVRTLRGHSDAVLACVLSSDGRQLVSASADHTLRVWELGGEGELSAGSGHQGAVDSLWLSSDGLQLLSGSVDGSVKLWDVVTGQVLRTVGGLGQPLTASTGSHDGKLLVTITAEQVATVAHMQSGLEQRRFSMWQSNRDTSSHGGSALAFPSDDHMIELMGMPAESRPTWPAGRRTRVRLCTLTPDGKSLVTGSPERMVQLWDLRTGVELVRCSGHTGPIEAMTLMPDGHRLVTASVDKTLVMWDLTTGAELMRFLGHSSTVSACAVSADGKRLLSGGHDKLLRLWDLSSGSELLRLSGHLAPVTGCVFIHEGRQAVSSSLDQMLKVWDLASGLCIETIYGHSPFCSVAAVGDWVCAGDQSGNVWILRDPSVRSSVSSDAPQSRQSLIESVRRLLGLKS